jgi:hypothetical protein
MKTNEEIVEMARALNQADDDVMAVCGNAEEFFADMTAQDFAMLGLAEKLLKGRPYIISTDNNETRWRAEAIAQSLGALCRLGKIEDQWTLRFYPHGTADHRALLKRRMTAWGLERAELGAALPPETIKLACWDCNAVYLSPKDKPQCPNCGWMPQKPLVLTKGDVWADSDTTQRE